MTRMVRDALKSLGERLSASANLDRRETCRHAVGPILVLNCEDLPMQAAKLISSRSVPTCCRGEGPCSVVDAAEAATAAAAAATKPIAGRWVAAATAAKATATCAKELSTLTFNYACLLTSKTKASADREAAQFANITLSKVAVCCQVFDLVDSLSAISTHDRN